MRRWSLMSRREQLLEVEVRAEGAVVYHAEPGELKELVDSLRRLGLSFEVKRTYCG